MKFEDQIEEALGELLSGKSKKTADEKAELRHAVNLAIKWQAVKNKKDSGGWGSGFGNDDDDTGENEDERNGTA